jgi:[ribosomal protein S5]-alanine N-acetyltransferase
MTEEKQEYRKETVESFAELFKTFGQAVGDIFNDPELQKKAKEFAESISVSADSLVDKLKEDDVKEKFRDVGKAAENFGKNIADRFKDKKHK